MGAETACAPARAGTILGVTRAIASPAYRYLEQFEPWLRLVVPALLALFLITLGASAFVQLRDAREETLADAINDIDVVATLAAVKFDARPAPVDGAAAATLLNDFAKELPAGALARGRTLLLVDGAGLVRAACPLGAGVPRSLNDLLGDAKPLTVFADRARVMTVRLATGEEGIATVRALPASSG